MIAEISVLDTFQGLPVHVLVVHAVVVLVPITAAGAIAIALVPRWSIRFGVLVAIFGVLTMGAAFAAKESGEQFARRVGTPAQHVDYGQWMPWFALALAVLSIALWLTDRQSKAPKRGIAVKILAAVVIVAAIASTVWVVLTGESGSRAVWAPIIENTPPR